MKVALNIFTLSFLSIVIFTGCESKQDSRLIGSWVIVKTTGEYRKNYFVNGFDFYDESCTVPVLSLEEDAIVEYSFSDLENPMRLKIKGDCFVCDEYEVYFKSGKLVLKNDQGSLEMR